MKISWMMGILAVGMLGMLLLAGCASDRGDAVMVVDGDTTTVDQFRQVADMRFRNVGGMRSASREELEDYMDVLLEGQLKVVDGRARGFANRPDVVTAYEDARRMAAIGKLYQEQIVGAMLPEDSLRMYYERNGIEVNASHILIRIDAPMDKPDPDGTLDDSVEAYDRAAEVYEMLMADGEVDSTEFAEAAMEYSEDTSAQNGELGYFGLGAMVPSFETATWALDIGEMSEPVFSPFGWHLIFVHDRREREGRLSYEDELERTRQIAMQANAQKLMDNARTYVLGLEEERGVEFEMDTMERIYDIVNPRLPHRDPFSLLTEEQLEWVVVRFDGDKTITAGDLREYVRQYVQSKMNDAEQLKALAENFVTERYLLPEMAESLGYLSDPEVLDQARFSSDMKIRQLVNQELNQLPEANDEELRSYFEQNMEDYMLEAQYTIVEILVDDRALADSVKALAEGGANMRDLASEYTTRPGAKEDSGVVGPLRRAQYGAIGRNASEAEIGEIVGPIRYQNKWSVFKVISKEEPKPDSFDNVRRKVEVDWKTWARDQRQVEYMDSLRATVDYKVFYDALDQFFTDDGDAGSDS